MRRSPSFALALALLASASCLSLSAQAEAPASAPSATPSAAIGSAEALAQYGRPRYMIYLFEAEEGTLDAEQSFVLYNSILASVAEANKDVVVLESPDTSVPRTKEGKEELARRVNADSWLSVVASGGFDNLTIGVSTFDILRQETIGEEIIRPGFVVDFRTVARGFWDSLVASIEGGYSRIVDLSPLTLRGRPGTEIEGVPGGPYKIDETGVLALKVPYPSVFLMHAKSGGAYDVEQPVSLGIDPLDLNLSQVTMPRFGLEASLSSLQFPAMRFWVSIIPARFFARLGLYTQAIGLYPLDNAASIVQTGSALSTVGLDAGLYVLPPERYFRLFVAAGGYLRIAHPRGYIGIDNNLAPGAATLSLGGEYSTSRRLRFVFSYEPAFILASDPQKFVTLSFNANSYPSGKVPGYVVTDKGLFDLRNFYFGARLDF